MMDEVKSRVIWRQVGAEAHRVCNLGRKHPVTVWRSKRVWDTGDTHEHNHGYAVVAMPIFADRQGRVYLARQSYDYHARVYYTTPHDPSGIWRGEPDCGSGVASDVFGYVLDTRTTRRDFRRTV